MDEKIYVLGPEKSGKTTFIQQYFRSIQNFSTIIESNEKIIPEDSVMTYVILPRPNLLRQRNPEIQDPNTIIAEWMKFYYELSAKTKTLLIEEDI